MASVPPKHLLTDYQERSFLTANMAKCVETINDMFSEAILLKRDFFLRKNVCFSQLVIVQFC